MDNGYSIDEDVIKKVLADQLIVRGDSLFDKKIFARIKEYITSNRSFKYDGAPTLSAKMMIDPAKELKKFSPVELDWVKDVAIRSERDRMVKEMI